MALLMDMGPFLSWALLLLEVGLAVVTAYVLGLTLIAWLAPGRPPLPTSTRCRFAILVPAHNEELLLGRLLGSLRSLDYARDCYDVYVVADNCQDSTASLASEGGALVYERHNSTLVGKGHALRWLLEQARATGRSYDAFVVLDADSYVSANFLRVMSDHLAAGSQAVQAYYAVANASDSWNAGLRFAALALVHYLRPLGKRAWGGSAGLKGNGMCFTSSLLAEKGWNAYTLAEDVEYHLQLVLAGITVDFAPQAVVWAEMPSTLGKAHSQNLRWERGRLEMARRYVPGLMWSGLWRRNLAQLDAALEQLVPPFSVPVALSGLCLLSGLPLGSGLVAGVGLGLLLGQLSYVLGGLLLVRAPRSVYLSLMRAPLYAAWKLWLYLTAAIGGQRGWVRTSRA